MLSFTFEYIIPFLFVLSILVIVHELGHYSVARYYGVKVDAFSIGFGPAIINWVDKNNTNWKISIIPLGGYVKMFGDNNITSIDTDLESNELSEDIKSKTFYFRPAWQRINISIFGPVFNFLFSIILLTLLFSFKGYPLYTSKVGGVISGSQAEICGLRNGDSIISINNEYIKDFKHLSRKIHLTKEDLLIFEIKRNSNQEIIKVPIKLQKNLETGKNESLGIIPPKPEYIKKNFFLSFIESIRVVLNICYLLVESIFRTLIGERSSESFGGIISIGDMAAKSVKEGFGSLILFVSLLSINLGMINLLPIPTLDGGHIMLNLIELIRGKPITKKNKEYMFFIGFLLIIFMMILSTWNDISRFNIFNRLISKNGAS